MHTAVAGILCLVAARNNPKARQDLVRCAARGCGSGASLVSTFAPADHAALTGVLFLSRGQVATGRSTGSLLPCSIELFPAHGMPKAGSTEVWMTIRGSFPPGLVYTVSGSRGFRQHKSDPQPIQSHNCYLHATVQSPGDQRPALLSCQGRLCCEIVSRQTHV